MNDTPPSLNQQLYNAVAAVAKANDRLATMRGYVDRAQQEERRALDAVNEAQKHLDSLVAEVKKTAPLGTDWNRP